MDERHFQFSLSVPRDVQFVPTIRVLAAQAARYASCGAAAAEAFAESVEAAVRGCLRESASSNAISIVVRRNEGPVEFLIDGRAVTVEP